MLQWYSGEMLVFPCVLNVLSLLTTDKVHLSKTDIEQPPLDVIHIYKDGGILAGVLPEYLGQWAAEKLRCQGVTLMPKSKYPKGLKPSHFLRVWNETRTPLFVDECI